MVAALAISSAPVQYVDYSIQVLELKLHRFEVALYSIGGMRRLGSKPGNPVSGLLGRITHSISEPIVASCRAETVPVELKQRLLPGLSFGRVIFRQEIDQFTHAARSVPTDHKFLVGIFHDAGIADREAFGFERQNIGNHAICVYAERQSIVACPTWPLLFFSIRFVHLTRLEAFVDQVEVLKFLIVKTEQQRWNHPIRMADRSEMLHREHA